MNLWLLFILLNIDISMKNKKLLIFVSGVIILFCIEIYLAYKINKLLENYPTITIHDTIYRKHSDWELLKVAIIWQESKGNSNAIGGNGYGIYQITPIYVKERNRILDTTKYRLSSYKGEQRKDKIARNLVDYEAGLTIFNTARNIITQSNIKQQSLFDAVI